MTRADLSKNSATVAAMFDQVASGYDVTRSWLWLRRMNHWGRFMAAAAGAGAGRRVLDVAAGTGSSSAILRRRGASVVACDFSAGMLAVGRSRHPDIDFVEGDAMSLPFADGGFDAVTISFGIRNIENLQQALAEMLRVTRTGGRLVVCEYSMPEKAVPRTLWRAYLSHVVPFIARRVSSNPEAYRYLAESIQAWHSPEALGARIRAAGWQDVGWHSLDGGVVVLHHARAGARYTSEPKGQSDARRS